MLQRKEYQIDFISNMIYDRLIPKNHILVKISETVDFSYIYEIVKDRYSNKGRNSIDPVMMFKICLIEFFYNLSDVEVVQRIKTDVAFRWFLGLNIDDEVPDDSTISHFRTQRLKAGDFENIFNGLVNKCIESNLIKTNRFIIDSTNVDANTNYPRKKELIMQAFEKFIRTLRRINPEYVNKKLAEYESLVEGIRKEDGTIDKKELAKLTRTQTEKIYEEMKTKIDEDSKAKHALEICQKLSSQIEAGTNKDAIVSVADEDARVSHKTPSKVIRGYKNHIIVDEESEIIISSTQTPANVGDEKELQKLIENVEETYEIKPREVMADKVYGTNENRAYLKEKDIISTINFYDNKEKEYKKFDLSKFEISEDLSYAKCPFGCQSIKTVKFEKTNKIKYTFDKTICETCPFKSDCYGNDSKFKSGRYIKIDYNYDGVIRDKSRNKQVDFEKTMKKRFKIERRFATMVRKFGLRRSRYRGLERTRIHIIMCNFANNVLRMVNLLSAKTAEYQPRVAIA